MCGGRRDERWIPVPPPRGGGGTRGQFMKPLEIINFGCRLNALEAEVMRRRAAEAGLADAVLINTCNVTEEAVRQARQAIRRARRERPQARILVTRCAAQTSPGTFAAMAEVDLVLGHPA